MTRQHRTRRPLARHKEYQRAKRSYLDQAHEQAEEIARRADLHLRLIRIAEAVIFVLAVIGVAYGCLPLVRAWIKGGW